MQADLFTQPTDLDSFCRGIISENPNMMIPWFLMACVAYDKLSTPILTDGFFDTMSGDMADQWEELTHFHKDLIIMEDPDNFKGSSVAVVWDRVPDRVYQATNTLLAKLGH